MSSPDYLVQLDLAGDGSFSTDATDDVRSGSLSRGTSSINGPAVRANTATATVTLGNGDGTYDPISGPHVGTLVPRVPMRILGPVHDTTSHVRTSRLGALVAPDSANLAPAGDLDLRALVTFLPGTPGGGSTIFTDEVLLVGKSFSYNFRASPGAVSVDVYGSDFPLSPRSFIYNAGAAVVPIGVPIWMRAVVDLDNGAGAAACTFSWSSDGSGWTTIASPADTSGLPGIVTINDTNAVSQIGGDLDDVSAGVALHEVRLSDAGGVYCTLDLTDLARRAATVASTEGDTFTLTGNAAVIGGTGRPTVFVGRVGSIELSYPVGGKDGIADLSAFDARDGLAAVVLAGEAVTLNGSTSLRLAELLDNGGWTDPLVADQGEPFHQESTAEGSLWAALQLAADSAGGDLWVDAEGRVVFRQRYGVLVNPGARTVVAEFADDGTGIDYLPSLSVTLDDDRRVSTARLTRDGGVEQEADDGTTVDVRTFERSDLNVATDTQVDRLARHYVGTFATPSPRLGKVTVAVHALSPADQAAVLAVDLGARIGVTHTAPGVAAWETEQVVRGTSDAWDDAEMPTWFRTFTVEDAALYERWVVGDSTLGVLGSTTRLA